MSTALTTKQKGEKLATQLSFYQKDLLAVLPKHVSLDRLKQVFVLTCKQNPKLLECDPASLIKAVFTCASIGLEPDPFLGQVYILPYKTTAQVIIGYKGLIRLIRNSGEIASVSCQAIHANDNYSYNLGTDPYMNHQPAIGDRGEIILFYCAAKFKDGSVHLEIMNTAEVKAVMSQSSAVKGGRETPWNTHFEEMGKKTVCRRAMKWLPVSPTKELSNAIALDDAQETGRNVSVDMETGEIIDAFNEPVKEPAQLPEKAQALDVFNSVNQEEESKTQTGT